jgi:hypothetical protein
VRLGQTERGSYVVTLLSPLGTDAAEAERAGRLPVADPSPRTAVSILARALEAARDTAERTAAGASLEAFHETVEVGVSANLCDSLARIGGRSRRGFDVSFGWSPAAQAPDLPPAVEFPGGVDRILARAAVLLRRVDEGPRGVLQGRVIRLQRQRDRGPGRIQVQGQLGQRAGRFAVDLDEPSYDPAIRAHREGAVITVEGRLVRAGQQLILADPRDFRASGAGRG